MSHRSLRPILAILVPGLLLAPALMAQDAAPTPQPSQGETDQAMTAFAATLRQAERMRFEVNLSARRASEGAADPLANSAFDVLVERPNRIRIESKDSRGALLVSNGQTLLVRQERQGANLIEKPSPAQFSGFRRELPQNLGTVEKSVFNTVLGLLSNDPAGFLVGESLDRSKYARFMLDGQAGEMFRFKSGNVETLIGLTNNAKPQILRLTLDPDTENRSSIVQNYSFKNWNLNARIPDQGFRLPGEPDSKPGSEPETSRSHSPGTVAPSRSDNPNRAKPKIVIEDSPAKPR